MYRYNSIQQIFNMPIVTIAIKMNMVLRYFLFDILKVRSLIKNKENP